MKKGLSILILSNCRLTLLVKTLRSIESSSQLPDEVLIADSSKSQIQIEQIQPFLENKKIFVKFFYTKQSVPYKRNFLLKKAKYNLCLFIDDDVMIRKSCIKNALKIVADHPEAVILSGICYPTNGENQVSSYSFSLFYGQYLHQKNTLIETNFCPTMLCLVQKNFLLKHHLWFDEQFLALEDIELCFRLRRMGGQVFISSKVIGDHEYRETYSSFYRSFYSYFLYALPLFQKSHRDLFDVSAIKEENLFFLTRSLHPYLEPRP